MELLGGGLVIDRMFIGEWARRSVLLLSRWDRRLDGIDKVEKALHRADVGRRREKGRRRFQADKSDYRGVLAGLEGITGKKAVNSDAMTVKN